MSEKREYAVMMAHMIASYPDEDSSREIARALIDGGARYIEVQFPFSDPSADGPVIQKACQQALSGGFTLEKGFSLVREIAGMSDIPVYIMSYGNLVFTGGVENFTARARDAGAAGLIIPDLTPGYDEGLYQASRSAGLRCVPVLAPSVSDERLERIDREEPEYVYAALRSGVTGSRTDIGEAESFLSRLDRFNWKVLAGFGIQSREQVEQLMNRVHSVIVGSYLIRTIQSTEASGMNILYDTLKSRVYELVTGDGEKRKTLS